MGMIPRYCELIRALRLRDVSHKVRGESMRVNAEFSAVEHDVDA
jgi:hypothetical protein